MPDLREVFEMVKQQTEPDLDSWAEQERRMRQRQRNQKIGAFALVAMFAIAAFAFVLNSSSDDNDAVPIGQPETESVDPAPDTGGEPRIGLNQYDLATGAMTGTGITPSSSAVDVSPDGTKMTYVGSESGLGDNVYVANVDGSDAQAFPRTDLAGEAKAPRWSPDGTKIVFQGKRGLQIGNLYVLDVATGRVEQITDLQPITAGIWWMAPTFSADGQTVYFNQPRIAGIGGRDIGQHWDIWSVPASGGEPTLIRRDAFMADVSPTGDAIAFVGARSGDAGFETAGVYVARPDGTDARRIADGSLAEYPRWSPDGSRIAYSADTAGIQIIDVESGEVQPVDGAAGFASSVRRECVRSLTYPASEREEGASLERSFRFPATVDAPRLARRALDGWLNELVGSDRANDVRLLTTELVTNAIRHGGLPDGAPITLDVEATEDAVSITVGQPTSAEQALLRQGAPLDEGGFGLQLVDQLADEWGVDHGTPGSVWFGVLRTGSR